MRRFILPTSTAIAAVILTLTAVVPPFLNPNQTAVAAAEQTSVADQKWTCPMHPHYIADDAGSCPICGMDLVRLETSTDDKKSAAQNSPTTVIDIPAETIQKMGVRIQQVEESRFGRNIRSYGVVKENERLRTELSARVEGWVENQSITAVGDEVKAGDKLFDLFSPELIVSQRDYLTASRQGGASRKNITRRLLSFGVQQQAIDLLDKQNEVMQNLPFYAEQDGTVAELNVTPGTYVKRGMTIAKIQDYSTVWIMVNVAENDMPFITRDTKANVYFPNHPGKTLNATVDYIYPMINSQTRTGRIRLVVDNKNGDLRPGTFADVVFKPDEQQRLSVPSEAILRDQGGTSVVIALGNGRFTPRRVDTGLTSGNRVEIRSGVKAGEDVVVSSQFLIDSESALRESFRKLERLQTPLAQLTLDKTHQAMFDHMVDAAIYVHDELTNNRMIEPKQLDPALSIRSHLLADYKNTQLEPVLEKSEAALKTIQAATTTSAVRDGLARLVLALEPWLLQGNPAHYKQKQLHLFMDEASSNKWLQLADTAKNPYGTATAKAVPWPDKQTVQTSAKQKMEPMKSDPSMRGSHGNH